MLDGPRTALAFLTRLPGGRHPADEAGLTGSVPWFPVIGILVGALAGASYVGSAELVSPLAAASLTFAITALITGGFHEDGLADSFDALAGGWNREQRLAILKDARHGTFGVLSLVLVTLLKVSGLASLSGWDAFGALLTAHCLGRAGAVALMALAPTARDDGLGADYARALPIRSAFAGSMVGVVVAAISFGIWAVPMIGALALAVAAVGVWSNRRIGGVTGDLLGAAEQVGEVVVLLAASAIVANLS